MQIKLCGMCCLMCVGTCVLVTVTTTVVHMSRLQSLRECVYTVKTQTCTCYSVLLESASERTDEGECSMVAGLVTCSLYADVRRVNSHNIVFCKTES